MILAVRVGNSWRCLLCNHEGSAAKAEAVEGELVEHLVDIHLRSPRLLCREEKPRRQGKPERIDFTGPRWKVQ